MSIQQVVLVSLEGSHCATQYVAVDFITCQINIPRMMCHHATFANQIMWCPMYTLYYTPIVLKNLRTAPKYK